MTLIVLSPLPTASPTERVHLIKNQNYLILSFWFFVRFSTLCFCFVFSVEDTGSSGGRATSEREAFDARNILKVRGNLLLPALSNTAGFQTFSLLLTK